MRSSHECGVDLLGLGLQQLGAVVGRACLLPEFGIGFDGAFERRAAEHRGGFLALVFLPRQPAARTRRRRLEAGAQVAGKLSKTLPDTDRLSSSADSAGHSSTLPGARRCKSRPVRDLICKLNIIEACGSGILMNDDGEAVAVSIENNHLRDIRGGGVSARIGLAVAITVVRTATATIAGNDVRRIATARRQPATVRRRAGDRCRADQHPGQPDRRDRRPASCPAMRASSRLCTPRRLSPDTARRP